MSNARLKVPMGSLFDDRLPENRVHGLWKKIEAARGRRLVPRSRTWALAIVAASVAALAVFWLDRSLKPGALRLTDGRAVPATMTADTASMVSLNDGSALAISTGARLEVLESTGGTFTLALRKGTTEFEVHPGGPRVWRVECAGVVIEVVGTHFTVARTLLSLRVSVERGVVLVRGDAVPDRVVRLSAGQSIVVPLTEPVTALTKVAPTNNLNGDATHTTEVPVVPSALARGVDAAQKAPTKLASTNGSESASAETSASAVNAPSAGASSRADFGNAEVGTPSLDAVDALMTDADSLRRAGRFNEATALLENVVQRYGNDPRAALAEFSLGRLYLDSLGNAVSAAGHFSHALARHLPAALAEDAQARLVEAFARAGNQAAAQNAAATYRSLYPNGRRSDDVARWARGGL